MPGQLEAVTHPHEDTIGNEGIGGGLLRRPLTRLLTRLPRDHRSITPPAHEFTCSVTE